MTETTYDVIVIGGGAGGVPAAIRAAQLGGRVALIEENHLGGLCMNRGCIPFGHMMTAARILGYLSLGKEMGVECSGATTNFTSLMKRQNELIPFMRQGVEGMIRKNKIQLFRGRGKLSGHGKVEVKGETLSGKKIILAAGGKWLKPGFPGSDMEESSNSDYLLETEQLPGRCLLVGDDPMIIEIAQFLHRFGSKTMLVTKENSILGNESKVIRTRLAKALRDEGIEIQTKTEILALKKKKDGIYCILKKKGEENSLVVDRVISLKRGASLEGLGLDAVGLDNDVGFLHVDERMETAVKGIYAIGDIAASEKMHYSHLASAGGIVAAENAMGMERRFDARTITRVAFTQPQVACVGLTPKEAKKAGYDVVTGAAPLSMNPAGMILSQNEGIVEVVAEKRYGEILGVHILGDGACELAGQAVMAIQMEATLEDLTRFTFPHPTLSESLPEAAREALGQAIFLP